MSSLTCGLAYVTALAIGEVEKWLEGNCPGDWTVRLADSDDAVPPGKKKFEILFELREDLDTFKARFKSFEAEKIAGRSPGADGSGTGAGKKEKRTGGMLRPDRN
jgi:hypothetical protein